VTGLLHPRLAELRAELDRTRDGLLAAVASVPAELAALRPEADRWSVAEVVEHLRIVEDRTGQLLGKLGKQAQTVGPEASSASVLSSLDHYGLRSPTRRIVAPDAVAPTGAITLAE
jgi:DinB superfamily